LHFWNGAVREFCENEFPREVLPSGNTESMYWCEGKNGRWTDDLNSRKFFSGREWSGHQKDSVVMSGSKTHTLHKCLPFAMAALAFLVTGCPQKEYIVELQPQGNSIERTLVFYSADGVNTNTGAPNYLSFDPAELAMITAMYPAHSLTNAGNRYTIRGEFTNELPHDVGGEGVFTNLTTSLGSAGFYMERFRGNDDLAGMTERRFKAADQLENIYVGWSQMELGREPGYDKLHKFLDVDFRRDLKNFSSYCWELQLVSDYKTNVVEEYAVRFGQYLLERGYFKIGEIPGLFRDVSSNDPQAILLRIQRLLARKMGVPDTVPIPPSLALLADETKMKLSFDKYVSGTDLYRAKLKQWEKDKKLKSDTKKPEPSEVVSDVVGNIFGINGQGDHLVVNLSLPMSPMHSNGRWDNALKQVVWDTHIESRTNATHLPFSCYASWVQANEAFQKEHLGKVALTGDDLTLYCLWRSSLDMQRGGEWDAFLSGLQPGAGLIARIDVFQFSGESDPAGTNSQQTIPNIADYPRELLKTAIGYTNVMTEAVQRLMNQRLTKPN
jgi:hypothetical protein